MRNEHEKDQNEHGDGEKPGTYKIFVDQKPHDWLKPVITGADIKLLARVDDQTYNAWQDIPGPEDLLIEDVTEVDLTKPGTEKFFTIKKTTTEG